MEIYNIVKSWLKVLYNAIKILCVSIAMGTLVK